MFTVRSAGGAAILLVCACGAQPAVDAPAPVSTAATTPREPAAAPAASGSPLRRIPLAFELGAKPFPSPLARVAANGCATWMLVDTGASYHALSAWLVSEVGAKLTTSVAPGRDDAGRPGRRTAWRGA